MGDYNWHWVSFSDDCDSKYIAVSIHLHAQIACVLMTHDQHAEVTVIFMNVVKQTGT